MNRRKVKVDEWLKGGGRRMNSRKVKVDEWLKGGREENE